MITEIIDGLCLKIHSIFGDSYEIYTEPSKQGLNAPCFFIACISQSHTAKLRGRYLNSYLFCIQYISEQDRSKEECYKVYEKLHALEYIEAGGDLIRGTDMKGEAADGVLSYFITYKIHVQDIEAEQQKMEEISNIKVKAEE